MGSLWGWLVDTFQLLGASVFDVFLVLALIGSYFQNKWLKDKYQLLNTGLSVHGWIIRLKLGVTTIRHHRNGDIELVNPINDLDSE